MGRGIPIWTDTHGFISNIPVEYTYADVGQIWYTEYDSTVTVSGGTFTLFIETKDCTPQGSIMCVADSAVTVVLYELPADGQSYASIHSGYTSVDVFNADRYNYGETARTDNNVKIKVDTVGQWEEQPSCTSLQTFIGCGYYPVDSISSRVYWKLNSNATYALVVTSPVDAANHVVLSYTWNETEV